MAEPGPPAKDGKATVNLGKVVDKIRRNPDNLVLFTMHTHPFTSAPSIDDMMLSDTRGHKDPNSQTYKWINLLGIIIHPNGKGISVYDNKTPNISKNDQRRTKCLNQ